jgi:hypothetical protein
MTLSQLLKNHEKEILATAQQSVRRAHLTHYEKVGDEATYQRLQSLYRLTAEAIVDRSLESMIAYSKKIARERYEAGFDLSEVQTAFNVFEEAIWIEILKSVAPAKLAEALGLVGTALGAGKDALAREYVSLASKTKAPSLNLQSLFSGTPGA